MEEGEIPNRSPYRTAPIRRRTVEQRLEDLEVYLDLTRGNVWRLWFALCGTLVLLVVNTVLALTW